MICLPEATGECTFEEEQEFVCPCCNQKFKQKVSITQEATVEFEFNDYAPDRYDER